MENNLIQESINKEKIQLNFLQSIEHFRVSIICLAITILSLTNGLKTVLFSSLNSTTVLLAIIFIILGLASFLYQQSRLKLISIESNQNHSSIIEKITELAVQKQWSVEVTANALLIKTERNATGRVFISKSGGEKIYIFFKSNKVLLRSLFDLKKAHGFVVSNGENNENENNILNKIKPAANTRQTQSL